MKFETTIFTDKNFTSLDNPVSVPQFDSAESDFDWLDGLV